PWVIDRFADGQRVWRLGTLHIEGVKGSWLGALHADHVSIADANGVWFEASNLDLDWRPQDLLFGGVNIDSAHARSVIIHRQPSLSEPLPSGGASMDVRLGAIRVDAIDVGEQTLGEAARFSAALSMDLRDDTLSTLSANVRRLDSDADRMLVSYRSGPHYLLNVDVN